MRGLSELVIFITIFGDTTPPLSLRKLQTLHSS